MRNLILVTSALFAVTLLLAYFEANFVLVFIFITLTLLLGSKVLGSATEELANYYSPMAGGLMNAALGNLPELIIGFFALREGLVDVVKASLTGSIVGNILLVFGAAVFVSGVSRKESKINRHEVEISSTMLLITSILLLVPSILFFFHEETHTVEISYAVAGALFLLYLCSIVFSFFTHKHYFVVGGHEKPKMKKSHAFILLLVSVAMLGVVSELFAGRLEPIAHTFGFGELFIGAIIVGIVGNAAEHLSAIQFARNNKMSLVLNTTLGSSIQIGMFVAPILVLLSALMGNPMTLSFLPVEIFAILLSVGLINSISRDKEVNWLEGIQLLFLYLIIAIVFFFYN